MTPPLVLANDGQTKTADSFSTIFTGEGAVDVPEILGELIALCSEEIEIHTVYKLSDQEKNVNPRSGEYLEQNEMATLRRSFDVYMIGLTFQGQPANICLTCIHANAGRLQQLGITSQNQIAALKTEEDQGRMGRTYVELLCINPEEEVRVVAPNAPTRRAALMHPKSIFFQFGNGDRLAREIRGINHTVPNVDSRILGANTVLDTAEKLKWALGSLLATDEH